MRIDLNGWRRIGVIFIVMWISTFTLFTISVYNNNSVNIFIYKTPAIGTIVSGNKLVYSDGKEELLDIPKGTEPWEIDWSSIVINYEEMPMVYKFNYQNLFIYFIVIPALGWLLVEVVVKSIVWVKRGFKK